MFIMSHLLRTTVIVFTIVLCASAANAGLIHRYSFKEAAVKDSVGKVDATVKGEGKVVDGKLVLENTGKTGGDSKLSYLEFNSSVIPKSGSTSLVVWITAKKNDLFSRVIDFGETDNGEGRQFIYLVARHEDDKCRGSITASDTGAKTYLTNEPLDDEKPHMAALVIDGTTKKLHLFVDGKESPMAEDLGDNTLDKVNPVHCWIGRSSFDADPGLMGSIDEFRVYDHALTADEVTAINKAGPDALPPAK